MIEFVIGVVCVLIFVLFIIWCWAYESGYNEGKREMMKLYLIKNPLPSEYRLVPQMTPFYNLEVLRWNNEYIVDYKLLKEKVTEKEAEEIIKNLSRPVLEIGDVV